jgi:hypothetical protein
VGSGSSLDGCLRPGPGFDRVVCCSLTHDPLLWQSKFVKNLTPPLEMLDRANPRTVPILQQHGLDRAVVCSGAYVVLLSLASKSAGELSKHSGYACMLHQLAAVCAKIASDRPGYWLPHWQALSCIVGLAIAGPPFMVSWLQASHAVGGGSLFQLALVFRMSVWRLGDTTCHWFVNSPDRRWPLVGDMAQVCVAAVAVWAGRFTLHILVTQGLSRFQPSLAASRW